MIIFKITNNHIDEYNELDSYDLGMYALKLSNDKELMVYETKTIAQKALEYFKKSFKE
jgi:hypothetical protein|tara:strand:+ start:449 stop:622 length:174 start_codon:yes stop_codon:yes gene_type:complete